MASHYKEYKALNFAQIADEILEFWKQEKIFEKSVSNREGAPSFTFYEGPPSPNGTPGIHHVMGRTVKDLFCRFKTLQGYQVKRKGGWDTHGLPVELQVEKQLGITKDDIGEKISIEEYNNKCHKTVMLYKDQWDDLTIKMGYWVDLDNPYITYKKEYIESLWWILKQFYDKGILFIVYYQIFTYVTYHGFGKDLMEAISMLNAKAEDVPIFGSFPQTPFVLVYATQNPILLLIGGPFAWGLINCVGAMGLAFAPVRNLFAYAFRRYAPGKIERGQP